MSVQIVLRNDSLNLLSRTKQLESVRRSKKTTDAVSHGGSGESILLSPARHLLVVAHKGENNDGGLLPLKVVHCGNANRVGQADLADVRS